MSAKECSAPCARAMFLTKAALSKTRTLRLGIAKSFVFEFAPSASSEPGAKVAHGNVASQPLAASLTSSHLTEPGVALTTAATAPSLSYLPHHAHNYAARPPIVLSPYTFTSAEKLSEVLDRVLSPAENDSGVADIWVPAKAAASLLGEDLGEVVIMDGASANNAHNIINNLKQGESENHASYHNTSALAGICGPEADDTIENLLNRWDAQGMPVQHVSAWELSPHADSSGVHLPAALVQKMSPHVRSADTAGGAGADKMGQTGDSRTSLASSGLINASANADRIALREVLLGAHPDDECAKHGASPLHLVAATHADESDAIDCVQLLLEEGASIDKRASNGSTPLHWAAGNGNVDVATFLLEQGADPSLMTFTWFRDVFGKHSGQTCLHWAAESGHQNVVEMLLERCPWIVGSRDERGSTPSALALREAEVDIHELLLAQEDEPFVLLRAKLEGVVAVPL